MLSKVRPYSFIMFNDHGGIPDHIVVHHKIIVDVDENIIRHVTVQCRCCFSKHIEARVLRIGFSEDVVSETALQRRLIGKPHPSCLMGGILAKNLILFSGYQENEYLGNLLAPPPCSHLTPQYLISFSPL